MIKYICEISAYILVLLQRNLLLHDHMNLKFSITNVLK